jgi:flagellar hook-length control protein FliK
VEVAAEGIDNDAAITHRRVPQLLNLREGGIDQQQNQNRVSFSVKSPFETVSQTAELGVEDIKTSGTTGLNGHSAAASSQDTTKVTPVRFVLPDRLEMTSRAGNRAVMIQVEPEHLGPARLYLTSHHDVISARLVVDTVAAKAAVEGSLDQLADQLQKAGVKVDHFDVTLSHEENNDHTRERQAFWAARPDLDPTGDDYFAGEHQPDNTAAAIRIVNPGYIRHDGVNVIA